MNLKKTSLTIFILTLFPITDYGQDIGIDTTMFIGTKYGTFGKEKTFEKSVIIIYPDSTYEQNDYYAYGRQCKLDIDKTNPFRTNKGYWSLKKGTMFFYSELDFNDSNLSAIYKVQSNKLIYEWKKYWRRIKPYLIDYSTENHFDKIYGEKPIIHYFKLK